MPGYAASPSDEVDEGVRSHITHQDLFDVLRRKLRGDIRFLLGAHPLVRLMGDPMLHRLSEQVRAHGMNEPDPGEHCGDVRTVQQDDLVPRRLDPPESRFIPSTRQPGDIVGEAVDGVSPNVPFDLIAVQPFAKAPELARLAQIVDQQIRPRSVREGEDIERLGENRVSIGIEV